MKYWKKLSKPAIKERVFTALNDNVDFYQQTKLGVPGSHLDDKVFYQDAPFLDDAPFLTTGGASSGRVVGCLREL